MKKLFLVFGLCLAILQITIIAHSAVNIDSMKKTGNSLFESAEGFMANLNPYEWINDLIQTARKDKQIKIPLTDKIVIFGIDLALSFFFTWLALWMSIMNIAVNKKYLWFILAFNILGFLLLLGFQASWEMLSYLVIRLQPDLSVGIQNNLCIIMIVAAIILYIWLLARSFNLNFSDAVKVFSISHLFYILFFAVFFMIVSPGEKTLLYVFKENTGFNSIIKSYVVDLNNIVTHKPLTSLARIRVFHL